MLTSVFYLLNYTQRLHAIRRPCEKPELWESDAVKRFCTYHLTHPPARRDQRLGILPLRSRPLSEHRKGVSFRYPTLAKISFSGADGRGGHYKGSESFL